MTERVTLLQEITEYDLCDIYDADETCLFFNIQPSKSLACCGDPCHCGTEPKQQVPVLLAGSADNSDELPPHVIFKYTSPRYFTDVKIPTKCNANTNSWITSRICALYRTQLDTENGY
jgi:hypothetical protein